MVTQNNRPIAVLVSLADKGELERLRLADTPEFMRLLEEADQRIQETGGLSHQAFWAQVEESSQRDNP